MEAHFEAEYPFGLILIREIQAFIVADQRQPFRRRNRLRRTGDREQQSLQLVKCEGLRESGRIVEESLENHEVVLR